ncbi:hypothetical protein [Streptomyces sp. NPDC020965]|uniref:hypothetical protein n=1 Tax=Streptomyces sp. NPDC020965 TaxID=3365105 RepID=UPI0037B01303
MIEDTRPAAPADVTGVTAVTNAAHHPSIERIGVVPAPMAADHTADTAAGRVFVHREAIPAG